ncbi:hypothetical protein LZ31DRAFT_553775 [Colletotrichum somersetense]|nr:hypothetical protein LZ31DRAFT_553775 [Colletotrichum somersetense]
MMSAMRTCLVAECLFSLLCAWNGSADYRTAQHSAAQQSAHMRCSSFRPNGGGGARWHFSINSSPGKDGVGFRHSLQTMCTCSRQMKARPAAQRRWSH